MRWLDGTTDLLDINLRKLQEIVEDRGAQNAIVHGVQRFRHDLVTQQQHHLIEAIMQGKGIKHILEIQIFTLLGRKDKQMFLSKKESFLRYFQFNWSGEKQKNTNQTCPSNYILKIKKIMYRTIFIKMNHKRNNTGNTML